jgi:hypothetical protein
MEVSFEEECEEVRGVIESRVAAQQSGHWRDPHGGGVYHMDYNTTSEINLHRNGPPNEPYDRYDKMTFTFSPYNQGCLVGACSVSQVTSVLDQNTNFCNLHDLYCSDEGCHPLSASNDSARLLKYHENIDDMYCQEHTREDCYSG